MNAGKSPTKHPGQAPPRRVANIATTGAVPFVFEMYFRSFIFPTKRIIVIDTKKGMIRKFSRRNGIKNIGLNEVNRVGNVTYV
ncbi:hypothetical protein HOD29_06155 [archaeon]|nr:hypothetical protein [archaeon]